MSAPISGTWFVCPTPFDADGGLDRPSIETLVDAAVSWGVDVLTVLGVMGEPAALTDAERDAVLLAFLRAADGRVPVAVRVLVARLDLSVRAGLLALWMLVPAATGRLLPAEIPTRALSMIDQARPCR